MGGIFLSFYVFYCKTVCQRLIHDTGRCMRLKCSKIHKYVLLYNLAKFLLIFVAISTLSLYYFTEKSQYFLCRFHFFCKYKHLETFQFVNMYKIKAIFSFPLKKPSFYIFFNGFLTTISNPLYKIKQTEYINHQSHKI